jgi:hypothetical protein
MYFLLVFQIVPLHGIHLLHGLMYVRHALGELSYAQFLLGLPLSWQVLNTFEWVLLRLHSWRLRVLLVEQVHL